MSTARTLKRLAIMVGSRALCHALEVVAFLMSLMFKPRRSRLPPIDDKLLLEPATALSAQIKSGEVSSEQVVERYIARIKAVNPHINALVDKRYDEALSEARQIDKRLSAARDGTGDRSILELPLVGVPVSVKETIAVEGHAFTGGLVCRKFVKAPRHSDAVAALIRHGMVPIGLTNIPELAMWWDSSNPVYGRTKNPYDLSRVPGGSSGGEGALIASAGSVVGIGSDIAGSIRMPCHFCGIFGHKPTPFVVSTEGMFPTVVGEREKLLGLGPMTRYACDLLPMLRVLAGSKSQKLKLDEPLDMSKLKVHYIEDIGDPLASKCNEDVLVGLRKAVAHLVDKFKVPADKVVLDELKHGFHLWSAEANTEPNALSIAAQLKDGRGDAVNPWIEIVKKIFQVSEHSINSILSVILEKFSPLAGTRANVILTKRAAELRKRFDDLVGDSGILLVPTHPEPAPNHFTTLPKVLNCSYTSVTSVLQAPITNCPLGMSSEGLPFGVQIIARRFNDKLTIAVAEELERAFGGWSAPCRITA